MQRFLGTAAMVMLAAVAPATAGGLFFDVSIGTSSAGPPYPTSATKTQLLQGSLPDPPQIGSIEAGIRAVTDTSVAAHMESWDPAGGPGVISTSSCIDVVLELSQPTPPPMTRSSFDIWMQPLSNSGQLGAVRGVGVMGGGSSSFFDTRFEITTGGGTWLLLYQRVEVIPGQPVHFAGGGVGLVGTEYHVVPHVIFDGPVDNNQPLFRMTTTPEPASMLLLLPGASLLRLPRRPNRPLPRDREA